MYVWTSVAVETAIATLFQGPEKCFLRNPTTTGRGCFLAGWVLVSVTANTAVITANVRSLLYRASSTTVISTN